MIRRRTATFTLIALAALGLACGSAGTGTTTSAGDGGIQAAATEAPKVVAVAIGKPMKIDRDILGSKTSATITVNQVTPGLTDDFMKPERGQYIAAFVSVQVHVGKYTPSATDYKLVAKDGNVYEAIILALKKPDLGIKELAAGQKTSGWVTFDAAKGAEKGAKIALKDFLAEGDAGYWQLP